MSDVFSFGVVLLELLTGRRSVDKSRPNREQSLVDWARPLLKDAHKLERIMDPRLEGQYSTQGARKAATLAYQCLSPYPKSRHTMSSVVKTLESVLKLNDIPVGYFVYIVPSEENSMEENKKGEREYYDSGNKPNIVSGQEEEEEEEKKKKKDKGRQRHQKGHRHRRQIKPLSAATVHSDTTLYKSLGTTLYSPKQGLEEIND